MPSVTTGLAVAVLLFLAAQARWASGFIFTGSPFTVRTRLGPRDKISSQLPRTGRVASRGRAPAPLALAYEPSPLDPAVYQSQAVVVGVSAAAAAFWWQVLVPAKRTELSLDKRKGEVGRYLNDLREVDEEAGGKVTSGDRKAERWLLRDWLSRKNQRKAAALPFLPKVSGPATGHTMCACATRCGSERA